LVTPAEVPLLAEPVLEEEVLLELAAELQAARAATPAITTADDSHRLPGRLIAHASTFLQFTTVA